MNIYAGDNGTVFQFTVRDNGEIVDIRGATVDVTLKEGLRRIVKTSTITDGMNGKCEVTLTSEDLSSAGVYQLQGAIKMQDGDSFSSDKINFTVGSRL